MEYNPLYGGLYITLRGGLKILRGSARRLSHMAMSGHAGGIGAGADRLLQRCDDVIRADAALRLAVFHRWIVLRPQAGQERRVGWQFLTQPFDQVPQMRRAAADIEIAETDHRGAADIQRHQLLARDLAMWNQ